MRTINNKQQQTPYKYDKEINNKTLWRKNSPHSVGLWTWVIVFHSPSTKIWPFSFKVADLLRFTNFSSSFFLLLCLYNTSTMPLYSIYHISANQIRVPYSPISSPYFATSIPYWATSHIAIRYLFPLWEHFVPSLGTFHSHRGNVMFPAWESSCWARIDEWYMISRSKVEVL